jgi:hypothetical protein
MPGAVAEFKRGLVTNGRTGRRVSTQDVTSAGPAAGSESGHKWQEPQPARWRAGWAIGRASAVRALDPAPHLERATETLSRGVLIAWRTWRHGWGLAPWASAPVREAEGRADPSMTVFGGAFQEAQQGHQLTSDPGIAAGVPAAAQLALLRHGAGRVLPRFPTPDQRSLTRAALFSPSRHTSSPLV